MGWIRPDRVHSALKSLGDWHASAPNQGSKHLLPLLALLEKGAGIGGAVFLREQRAEGVHRWSVTSVAGLDEIDGLPDDVRAEAAAYLAQHAVAQAPEPLPPPDAADVRAEASRRTQAVTGARDAGHLSVLISNASREAIRLLRIKAERPWTTEEAVRAAALEAADAAIEAIRAASNTLEAMQPVPADYRDDARWP